MRFQWGILSTKAKKTLISLTFQWQGNV